MKKETVITWVVLLLLTLVIVVLSKIPSFYAVIFVLLLSSVKFVAVAFQFMDLKKANNFWKGLVIGYLILFIGIISILI